MKDVDTLLPFFHYVRQQYEQEYNHSRLRCGALGSGDHAIERRLVCQNNARLIYFGSQMEAEKICMRF